MSRGVVRRASSIHSIFFAELKLIYGRILFCGISCLFCGISCLFYGMLCCVMEYRPVDHDDETFPEHKTVTFVGRPFPLEEAHEHFARLRRWGMSFSTCYLFVYFVGLC